MRALAFSLILLLAPWLGAADVAAASTPDEIRALPEDTTALKLTLADDAALKTLKRLTKLTHLTISVRNSALSAPGFEALATLESLRELEILECSGLDDAALKQISWLTGLTRLFLDSPGKITRVGLAHLRELRALTTFSIWSCDSLDDAGLKEISHLQALTDLDIAFCDEVGDPGVAYLGDLPVLVRLVLNDLPRVDGSTLAKLKLENLESLNLAGCALGEAGVRALGKCAKLNDLEFEATKAPVDAFSGLATCKALKKLRAKVPADAACMDAICALTTLQTLRLPDCGLTDKHTGGLGKLSNLRILRLSGNRIGDGTLALIGGLKNLEHLHLGGSAITGEGVKQLGNCLQLQTLDLGRTAIDDGACAHIAKLSKLTELNLAGTKIGFTGVDALSRLSSLQKIDLGACESVGDICAAPLSAIKSLMYINLKGAKVSAEKIAELKKALPLCAIVHD